MFNDPQFWVAVAFFIFIIAIFKPVKKILISNLDSKIKIIKENINQAENLKNEAQIILSDIKKRQNEVKIEIENIRKEAIEKIGMLESQANIKLKEQIKKRELLSSEKIKLMVKDANITIQNNISQTSIETVVFLLQKKLNKDEKQNLITQSIKDLNTVFKN